jgi:hypothetical protein
VAIVCPNPGCRASGCFKHCNHCGKDILWRPPGLDLEILYRGPKPLDPDGKPHDYCMRQGTSDGRFYYTGKKSFYDQFTEGEKNHALSMKTKGYCDVHPCTCPMLPNGVKGHYIKRWEYNQAAGKKIEVIVTKCKCGGCNCHDVDAMKDPEIKKEWVKQKYEWLKKWSPKTTPDRYTECKYCRKPMVKNETGTCDVCYWYDIWWNQGGVRVEPQRWG